MQRCIAALSAVWHISRFARCLPANTPYYIRQTLIHRLQLCHDPRRGWTLGDEFIPRMIVDERCWGPGCRAWGEQLPATLCANKAAAVRSDTFCAQEEGERATGSCALAGRLEHTPLPQIIWMARLDPVKW